MSVVTAERQFHAAIFQQKMEQHEIEREITKLEKKFKHAEKIGNVSGTFEIQDELGVMYNRLMKIWRIKYPSLPDVQAGTTLRMTRNQKPASSNKQT